MKKFVSSFYAGLFVTACLAPVLRADVKLPAIFGDHMVLQQDSKLPVWGWADPGEQVTVTAGGQQASVTAGADGSWRVELQALKLIAEPIELTVKGKNTLTFKDVLVGDVWLCSGQSNMEWPLWATANGKPELAQADYPLIRLFKVTHKPSLEPLKDCEGQWVVCTPQSAGGFSAVAYYFGRDLHRNLNRPVGLVGSHWGGSFIQAWTSVAGLSSENALKKDVALLEELIANKAKYEEEFASKTLPAWEAQYQKWLEEVRKPYDEAMRVWNLESQKAKKEGKPVPPAPKLASQMPGKPTCRTQSMNNPAVLFNGMIQPLVPYAIKGAIWYQGESNANVPSLYEKMLPTLIADWRKHWGQGDFPFLFVQLPNFNNQQDWAAMREAQARALAVPNTGMAVTIDVGDPANLHPPRKAEVGSRLALVARSVAYGQTLVHSGPVYRQMRVEGDKVRLGFELFGGSLAIAPGGTTELLGFAVAGADGNFAPAQGRIENNTVLVWSEQVKQPVAVRYAWANAPEANLCNKEGLPARPFRTDDWPPKKR